MEDKKTTADIIQQNITGGAAETSVPPPPTFTTPEIPPALSFEAPTPRRARRRPAPQPVAPAPENPPTTPASAVEAAPASTPIVQAPAILPQGSLHTGPNVPVVEMHGITKSYFIGKPNELEVLHGVDITINTGEFVAIVGESGSGKSTLMNIIGVLDKPTKGTYMLDGMDVHVQPDSVLSRIRNQKIGFVFQTFNLIGRTSARRNVEMPMLYGQVSARKRSQRAKDLLAMVGMADRGRHQPNELSGGQKQRVAIARAMAMDPPIILADEPTGALDSATGRLVMDIFHDLHKNHGKTIVLITHSPTLAKETQRIFTLSDGRVISETKGKNGQVAGAVGDTVEEGGGGHA